VEGSSHLLTGTGFTLVSGHLTSPDRGPDMANAVAVDLRRISMSFGDSRVLSSFDLSLIPGEIHVLLGANGSGKSTLIKILSGLYLPEPGGVATIGDGSLVFGSSESSYGLGCRFVHQDLGLIDTLSVLDNLHLGHFPAKLGTIRPGASRAVAAAMLEAVGLDLDPLTLVSTLSASERTGVALARALRDDSHHPPHLLVLDEPTAALPPDEVDHLLSMVRRVSANGVAVLFVTHHMEEVQRIAGSVSVLRDGHTVGRFRIEEANRERLVELIAGGALETLSRPEDERSPDDGRRLVVRDLTSRSLRGVSLTVQGGEILGIAGLTGSGSETLLRAIFGAVEVESGYVSVEGKRLRPQRPDLAMAAGIGYLPADRKSSGGIMGLSARENLVLADLKPFWSKLRLKPKPEAREASAWFNELSIRPNLPDLELVRFSGGNQQKILFAKWLRRRPKFLLLDEPSQGVDVAAKVELHRQVLAVAATGTGVVISTSDFDELASLCTRVLIMHSGSITDELDASHLSESSITRAVLAQPSAAGTTKAAL
jgi:ribose transport system ATP-binding protein